MMPLCMATLDEPTVGNNGAGELSPQRRAIAHYQQLWAGLPLAAATIAPLGEGLINETFLVSLPAGEPGSLPVASHERPAVLQRVNPLFGRAIHDDIEAITAHLATRQLATPRLYRTDAGELSVDLGQDGVWRLLSFVPGRTHSLMVPSLAAPAGQLVGRFHAALSDLSHRFHFVRPGAHDLGGHLAKLRGAMTLAARPDFIPAESAVPAELAALGQELLRHGERLPLGVDPALPLRLCHGDLKLSNLRFDDAGQGVCLLDLDTLAMLPLALELGDALRSWCNPAGEDAADSGFDLALFESALAGYAGPMAGLLKPCEPASIVAGVERITFQLAVRFAADVVGQSYFRWNRERYPSRAAHNLARAIGQWRLCRSLIAARPRADAIVGRVFARPQKTSRSSV
jgi:Ser/Thr protein kinase RdoA (MazF antagonist)